MHCMRGPQNLDARLQDVQTAGQQPRSAAVTLTMTPLASAAIKELAVCKQRRHVERSGEICMETNGCIGGGSYQSWVGSYTPGQQVIFDIYIYREREQELNFSCIIFATFILQPS